MTQPAYDSPTKKAFIAALVGHPRAAHYAERAFAPERLPAFNEELKRGTATISKNDLLTMRDDEGRLMVAASGFWPNFERIVHLLRSNHDELRASDFLRVIDGTDKTLLKMAEDTNNLSRIFNPIVFPARADEAEMLWYHAAANVRRTSYASGFLPVKRAILKQTGQTPREDILEQAGLSVRTLPTMFKADNTALFEDAIQRLKLRGDTLKKKDLLLPDTDGDTMFYYAETWNHFEVITSHLAKNGERFTIDDYLFNRPNKQSMLTSAAERQSLSRVFDPKLWVGRVEEMAELWTHVKQAQRNQIEKIQSFEEYLAEAEGLTYAFKFDARITRAMLTEPVDLRGDYKILPLGLKSTWVDIGEIRQTLDAQGEPLCLADLRPASGIQRSSCMVTGAKLGYTDVILDVARVSAQFGDHLTFDDLTTENANGTSLLKIFAEQKKLKTLFDAGLWAGRVTEMERVWQAVPIDSRAQVDFYNDLLPKTLQKSSQQLGKKMPNRPSFKPKR